MLDKVTAASLLPGKDRVKTATEDIMAKDKEKARDDKSCLGCSKSFTKADFAVQCTVCGLWAHKTCSGCTDEVFQLIEAQRKASGRSYWACRPCMVYAEGMNHRLRQMEDRIEKVEKLTETTAQNVRTVEDRVNAIDKALEKVEKASAETTKNSESGIFEELREREIRKLNVVLHRVGECENESAGGQERKEWDTDSCLNIFREMKSGLQKEDIKFLRRVGDKGAAPRPMVVGLFSEQARKKLLEGTKQLRDTFFKDVQVVPDLTKIQREEEEKLRRKAEDLNTKLSEEDRSKNLQWMVVGAKGEKRIIKAVPRTTWTQPGRNNKKRTRMDEDESDSEPDTQTQGRPPPTRRGRNEREGTGERN